MKRLSVSNHTRVKNC